ncbi:hypothetical protein D3C71_1199940 [compost metagenome]
MPLRPTAETMPEVTVWLKPNGLPMATTKSPTRSWSLLPSGSAVSLSAGMRINAMSVSRSEPMNSALTVRPSARVTCTSSALSITWWLVSTRPALASMMTPEPSDSLMRSCGTSGNSRRKKGSLKYGLRTRTTCLVLTLTTAGIARSSIGASEGTACPATEAGSAAVAGITSDAGAASARLSRCTLMAEATKPPKAAASASVSRVGSGRMVRRFRNKEGKAHIR